MENCMWGLLSSQGDWRLHCGRTIPGSSLSSRCRSELGWCWGQTSNLVRADALEVRFLLCSVFFKMVIIYSYKDLAVMQKALKVLSTGLEPMTFALSERRATNCATRAHLYSRGCNGKFYSEDPSQNGDAVIPHKNAGMFIRRKSKALSKGNLRSVI